MARDHLARRRFVAALAGCLLAGLTAVPSSGDETVPQVLRGVTPPPGFAATPFAVADGLLSSVTVHDGRLYATVLGADLASGHVAVWDLGDGVAGPPTVFADSLQQPLGITVAGDGTVYVSENADSRGRVTALADDDGDGVADTRRTVIGNLPNGRHQTNGLAFGADGWLYVANGNATDNGVECGPEPASPAECPAPEHLPWSGAIVKVDPQWEDVDLLADVTQPDGDPRPIALEDVLVAHGFRNIYDLAFRPGEPHMLYTVMNGSDNPASSEPYYRTDVTDEVVVDVDPDTGAETRLPVIDDMGFPSCLYDPHPNPFPLPGEQGHSHPGEPRPQQNPVPAVAEQFPACDELDVRLPLGFTTEGHEGTSGIAFVPDGSFPAEYDGDLLVAEWGSLWNLNALTVTGHKIIHADINPDGTLGTQTEFMTTPLPMDMTFGPDGALYVADMTGVIVRVTHVLDAP